jgi:all-trans-retinol 13,14-reductase
MKYEVVILGSGLGGLQCAYILSQEGYKVCLIEKNQQLGGCLQTFTRDGSTFDTGMHYIGSMDEGQVLNQFFNYFKLTGKLKLKRLDENGYDIVQYKGKEYKFAMGYERFMETLLQQFPGERDALTKYVGKLKEINHSVDIYNLRELNNINPNYFGYYSQSMDQFLDSIIANQTLKKVLLSLSPLYAGLKNRTPLYLPMIIHSSFIGSAYRFIDGGSQISSLLSESIRENGGTILKKTKATKFLFKNNSLFAVETNNSELIEGKYFIANMHPKRVLELIEGSFIKPAYRKRIYSIEETCGMFSLYLSLHENSFKYKNWNIYNYNSEDFWEAGNYTSNTWPQGYMIHFTPVSNNPDYTNAVIVNTYMKWEEVKQWENTTVENRGAEYKIFKLRKAERLLNLIEKQLPGIKKLVKSFYTSTPLTYRDYIGSFEGSVYGIQKDYNNPLKTMILPKTHVPNLFLTGQNVNIHGVIGVTIGSVFTCAELLGMKYLLNKIRDAQE